MNTTPAPSCPRCGKPLPAGHAGGNCASCLLHSALFDTQEPHEPGLDTAPAESAPPEIGGFEILGEIGRGGTGIVFKARQHPVNRVVALKTLHGAALSRRDEFERLRIEAEAVGRLEHPHIVPLYEVGRHAGTPFLTLRYFEKGSLADALRTRRFTPHQAARLAATAARAVHHAHQRGVLHRDIKPSNLLLDADDVPHVADFGLAKLAGHDSELTLSTSVLGTPSYMAPEQAGGRAREAGVPADVYGLGAILYELLTGHPPFSGASALEVLRKVVDDEPAPIRPRAPGVDADLEAVCLRCLEKEPARRYETAGALADDLDRWLQGEPVQARPSTVPRRLARWMRRRPLVTALLAAVLVALAGGITTNVRQTRVARAEREVALGLSYRAALEFAENSIEAGNLSAARERLLQQPDRFRGLEWGRLMAKAHTLHRSVPVLTNDWLNQEYTPVWGALSEDGRWIAAGSAGRLEVVHLADARSVLRLGSPTQAVTTASFHPDGNRLAITGPGTGYRLLECGTWKELAHLEPTESRNRTIHFSGDGASFLTAAEGSPITVRSARDFSVRYQVPAEAGRVFEWAGFSGSGKRLFARSRGTDGRYRWHVWEAADGAPVDAFPEDDRRFMSVEFNHDGTAYAAVEPEGFASAWDVGARRPRFRAEPEGHPAWIGWAALSDDGTRMATLMHSPGRLTFWNLESGLRLPASLTPARALGRGGPNAGLVTSAYDRLLHVWDWKSGLPLESLPTDDIVAGAHLLRSANGHWVGAVIRTVAGPPRVLAWGLPTQDLRLSTDYPLITAAAAPGGKHIASGSRDGGVWLWAAASGQREQFLPGHQWYVSSMAWTADGRSLFSVGADRRVHRWRMPEATIERSFEGLAGPGWPLDITPDGSRLAVGTSGRVVVWDGNSGQKLLGLTVSTNRMPWLVRFSPDGRKLAVSGAVELGGVFDVNSGKRIHDFLPPGDPPEQVHMSAAFSPDGRRLASVRLDGWLEIRDTRSWSVLTRTRIRSVSAAGIQFTPDGSRIVLLTAEGSQGSGVAAIEICDGSTGESLVVLDRREGSAWNLALDPSLGFIQRATLGWDPALCGVEFHRILPWRDRDLLRLGNGSVEAGLRKAATDLREQRWQHAWNAAPHAPEPAWREDRSFWPARNPATPSTCIDLTEAYNGHLDSGWIPAEAYEGHEDTLHQLPKGIQQLDGVTWDIRGVVSTGRVGYQPFIRWRIGREVLGIPVHHSARRLHFLHAAQFGNHVGERAGTYRIHYTDGSTADLPLIAGRDIGEWWDGFQFSRCDAGSLAWEGATAWSTRNEHRVHLYHRAWDNPHPDREIRSIDLIAEGYAVIPFVVALSVEP